MTIVVIILTVIVVLCLGFLVSFIIWNGKLVERAAAADRKAAEARAQLSSEVDRIYAEAQAAVGQAQSLADQQSEELKKESVRVRQHYLAEARKIQSAANATIIRLRKEFEPLQKYEGLRDAESPIRRQLAEALDEATALRNEAIVFLQSSRASATEERAQAKRLAKDIHEQADARLDQAILDAGRIIDEADKRAQEIGGDAYAALKDKRILEQAAQAMRNIIEGYGDRYLVPTHSLLDDLALEYGYDAAGESLASAREQSRKMVEQGQAAACDYAEASRRATAIQFVIHAFNGSVDAILTRTRSDNYGVLAQKIRDVWATVNREGSAFRNARILETYLDARLEELKWAVVVQELAQRAREEQRYLKEQERDRQKAEEERQRQIRAAQEESKRAAAEQELNKAKLAEIESRRAQAKTEEERAILEQEVRQLRDVIDITKLKLDEATQRILSIAQLTNKGCIYVISNVGSFGDGVFKIGLTRRKAEERVDELSNASVPFEFDIHAVIETDDAPATEYKIHQNLVHARINKINLRKEFFRIDLTEIRKCVDGLEHGNDFTGSVIWTEMAKAQQYRESLKIEGDPEKKEKWIKRAKSVGERRKRDATALPQEPRGRIDGVEITEQAVTTADSMTQASS